MIIDCISDLHGVRLELPGGDLLIIAGDMTAQNKISEWKLFYAWLGKQNYKKIVYTAGNHDNFLKDCVNSTMEKELFNEFADPNIEYLCDSGTEFEGLKIWGSPWTRYFKGVNPHCTAFMIEEDAMKEKFDLIPKDTDILITHTPPLGILDYTTRKYRVGCKHLQQLLYSETIKPKLHVFGHIHEAYGHIPKMLDCPHTQFVNAAHMNSDYIADHPPIRIIL